MTPEQAGKVTPNPRLSLVATLTLAAAAACVVSCAHPPQSSDDRAPAVPQGVWARYAVAEGQVAGPGIDEIILAAPAIEQTADGECRWFQMEAYAKGERLFAFALLASSLDFLREDGADVTAHRYILFPANGEPLEYLRKRTGKALLPNFEFLKTLVPKTTAADPELFFSEGVYLGHLVRRVETGADARLLPVEQARRLVLDDDVIIGTSRNFKDAEGIRIREREYTYTPLTPEDYQTLIQEVGMNRFPVAENQLINVIDQPVFFILGEKLESHPEILYRSNFLGTQQFMDEPVTIAAQNMYPDPNWADHTSKANTPRQAAESMVKRIREELDRDRRNLTLDLKKAGWDLGNAEIVQAEFPVWEACPSGAWYEFEAGLDAMVYEGRFNPRRYQEFMKEFLDVDFPDDLEACINLDHAFFRGAARHFGREWGTAIYGQATPDAAALMFPMAYDQGATYFWFWTSDLNHHMPFPEQKQLTREFGNYIAAHPRTAPPEQLLDQAQVAIALPWGYLYGEFELSKAGLMWGSPNMKLDADNGHGTTYKGVLKAALDQAVRLLRADIPFDFIFLRENERASGYVEAYRVLESGKVVVE